MDGHAEEPRELYVVTHTHWDREWYATYQEFRLRLVRLLDRLLDQLDAEPDYRSFLLDAQSVVLEDYLELRPEQAGRLRTAIHSGRLEVGPWYVQPDQSLVGGESLVRNFLAGRRVAAAAGAPGGGLRVGYLPDMFGHIGQMPQVLRGFGIDNAVLWRGISGEAAPAEFVWDGPDGSSLLVLHLPDRRGYSMLHRLKADPAEALRQIGDLWPDLDPGAHTPLRLLLVGSDHVEPQRGLAGLLAEVAALDGAPGVVAHDGLGAYVDRLRAALRERGLLPDDWSGSAQGMVGLPRRSGELRDTNRSERGGFNFLLPNVLSSRQPLKARNAAVERALVTWAEPLSALARLYGAPSASAFLRLAWRQLLQNHPHDSIGGCSRDEVHRAMGARFDAAEEIAEQVTLESAARLALRMNTADLPPEGRPLVLLNPTAQARHEVVDVLVDLAPGSWRDLEVLGPDGGSVPAQVVERRDAFRARGMPESDLFGVVVANPAVAPAADSGWFTAFERCQQVRLRLQADVPAMGWSTYRVRPVRRGRVHRGTLRTGPLSADNGRIALECTPQGELTLRNHADGRVWRGCLQLQDGGDAGDGYCYAPPAEDRVLVWQPRGVAVVEDGPVAVRLRLEGDFVLPAALEPGRRRRADATAACPVAVDVTLAAGAPLVDVAVRFTNLACDHRLRLVVPTGLRPVRSRAQMQWDFVERPTAVDHPPEAVWIEDAPSQHPTHGLVDASEAPGGAGFALVGWGLYEYELTPRGELALTLLRAVGHLGAPEPLTIVNGAGPGYATPDGQLPGETLELHAALVPHGPQADSDLWSLARAWQQPVRAFPQSRHPGELGLTGSWMELPAGADVSALKEAEDGDGVVLRLFNPAQRPLSGAVSMAPAATAVETVRLDETSIAGLAAGPDGAVAVRIGPRALAGSRWRGPS